MTSVVSNVFLLLVERADRVSLLFCFLSVLGYIRNSQTFAFSGCTELHFLILFAIPLLLSADR